MPEQNFLKRSLPETDAENPANYASRINSLKDQANQLYHEVLDLESKKQEILSGNHEKFVSMRAEIKQKMSETEAALNFARIMEDNWRSKSSDLDNKIDAHGILVENLSKEKESFDVNVKLTRQNIKTQQDAVGKLQKEVEELKTALQDEISTKLVEIDKREKAATALESCLNDKSSNIEAQKSQHQDNLKALASKQDQLASDVDAHNKKSSDDLTKIQTIHDSVHWEVVRNETLLKEIQEQNNKTKDLIINHRMVAKDAEKKVELLASEQAKHRALISEYQALRNELSGDSTKPQEASK